MSLMVSLVRIYPGPRFDRRERPFEPGEKSFHRASVTRSLVRKRPGAYPAFEQTVTEVT